MIKRDELASPDSCINRAADDEPVFVLRAKDPTFGAVIREWIELRIAAGIDDRSDPKLTRAAALIALAEQWRRDNMTKLMIETYNLKGRVRENR